MQSKCPKLVTRWAALGTMCKWLLDKRVQLLQYIQQKQPTQAPPTWWWIVVAAIGGLAQQTNVVITKLQSKDLIISQQTTLLTGLASSFCQEIQIEGPYDEAHINSIDKQYNSTYGSYSVSHDNVNLYLQDQGIAVQESLLNLGYEASRSVVNIIGIHMVRIVDGLFKIQVERNSANCRTDCYTIPPVFQINLSNYDQQCSLTFSGNIFYSLTTLGANLKLIF